MAFSTGSLQPESRAARETPACCAAPGDQTWGHAHIQNYLEMHTTELAGMALHLGREEQRRFLQTVCSASIRQVRSQCGRQAHLTQNHSNPLASEKQSKCCWVEAHQAHMLGKVCAHKHVVCKCNKSQGHFIFTEALHQEPRFSQRYSNPQLACHVSCFMPCVCTPQLHARDMLSAPPTGLVLQITHSASSQLPR
jgi:hypothetical protein